MKSKPIIILITTLIVCGAIGFFAIKPVISSIWSSWNSLEEAREDLNQAEEKKKILDQLSQNPELANVGQIALKYIPKEEESGELVIELTAIASANNLKVEETSMEKKKQSGSSEEDTSSSPKPKPSTSASPSSPTKEVQFSIKIAGTFPDFMNFLRAIDSSSRLISLKTLGLQVSQNKDQAIFTAQIGGVAFYKTDITLANNLENIKVSDDTIRKFLNLKTYGAPINLPTESGFGRGNPFEGF